MFKKLKRKFEAGKVLSVAVAFFAMVFLNNAGARGEPFSAALYFALLYSGAGVITYSMAYTASFLFTFSWDRLLCAIIANAVFCVIYGLFGRKKRLGLPSIIFLPTALIPYVLIGDKGEYGRRLIVVAVITVLSIGMLSGIRAVVKRAFRRPERSEILSLALVFVVTFTGGIKYMGTNGYKAVAVLCLAFFSALLSGEEGCFFSLVLAIPHAIYLKSVEILAPYLALGTVAFFFSRVPRPLYAVMMISVELTSAYLIGWYGDYGYVELIYFCSAILLFALIPQGVFKMCEKKLALSADKPLPRYEINRTRNAVSGRLYEISGTFREISELFSSISKRSNPFLYEDAIIEEVGKICDGCSFCNKCKATGFPDREELIRLIAIGKGKGRLTTVDLPKRFAQKCAQAGKIVYSINKYVGLYSSEMEKQKATEQTRQLVGLQADGVASALKGIAKTLSKNLSYQTDKEKKLGGFLLKKGVNVQEVMIFGEGDGVEIHLTVASSSPEERLLPAINEHFKAKHSVVEKLTVSGGKEVFVIERACPYDCIFGVAGMKKNGEADCGDTHSLIKISRNRFMLALSDGMGSGESARVTSKTALSLIECFYRAGIPPEVSLSTVNRLLSFAGEDNFAALDLGVINLDSLSCEFIKLGAPYGFIVSKDSVRLIEGSSLPMGILNELKPSVCTEQISPGDVILFLSDGVTDAFGSATDLADFLSAASITNPQRLADKILQEAFMLYGNKAGDDMTVVACKIFAA
ncbi:MAG: SpoIIE family protein phosphatase [Clostridia bacterium]|nr:SpoIIE family protein phosphatase [Clostridia bacterium]